MLENYVLNGELKRLEPLEKKCQFCSERDSMGMDDNYFLTLYAESDRTNLLVYRSVKFKKILIGIPRCAQCRLIHAEARFRSQYWCWGISIVVFLLSIYFFEAPFSVLGSIPALIFGLIGTFYVGNEMIRNKGIPTELEGSKENETVQDLLIQGWSLHQPVA